MVNVISNFPHYEMIKCIFRKTKYYHTVLGDTYNIDTSTLKPRYPQVLRLPNSSLISTVDGKRSIAYT